jgi:acyl-CoA dehydrogenase
VAIDFSVDPEFQETLDWIQDFVETEVAPLDHAFSDEHVLFDKSHPVHKGVVRGLQQEVRDRDLWACHLGPELGGKGYGQVNLALMNEILGRSGCASAVLAPRHPTPECRDPRSLRH